MAIIVVILVFTSKFIITTVVATDSFKDYSITSDSRILLWRDNLLSNFHRKDVVIYNSNRGETVGTIVGLPSERVKLVDGDIFINNIYMPKLSFTSKIPLDGKFSSRDNISPILLPKKGETINSGSTLDSICQFYKILKQENKAASISAKLLINGEVQKMVFIKNFILYTGLFSTIPEEKLESAQFWNSLLSWYRKNREGTPEVELTVSLKKEAVTTYRVKSDYYYLLNRDYNGFDSRYNGPISKKNIIGNVSTIKWPTVFNKSKEMNLN